MTNTTSELVSVNVDAADVFVGDKHSAANNIIINMENNGDTKKFRLTLAISYGVSETDLIALVDTPIISEYYINGVEKKHELIKTVHKDKGEIYLQTNRLGDELSKGNKITIKLSDFVVNTPPGQASIKLLVSQKVDGPFYLVTDRIEKITKQVKPNKQATLHYFEVTPDYIHYPGEQEVKLHFCASDFKELTLYRNNQEIKTWTENDRSDESNRIVATWPDDPSISETPSITTVYRIEGKEKTDSITGKSNTQIFSKTVQAMTPGWNQIALPQGYPSRLFSCVDFDGSGKQKVYGIFINRHGKAALYSSLSGIDNWELESDKASFPQDFKESPGVVFDNKLWLFGGSSINSKQIGGKVYCYEKSNTTNRHQWIEKPELKFPDDMPSRMGHACFVDDNRILVIGGYNPNQGGALSDVWQLSLNKTGQYHWQKKISNGSTEHWPARLHPAVASFMDRGKKVFVLYGGSSAPQSGRLRDIWWSNDIEGEGDKSKLGDKWTKGLIEGDAPILNLQPSPGNALGSAMVTLPGTESGDPERLFLMGSFQQQDSNRVSSHMFEWHSEKQTWQEQPVLVGWQQFQGELFYMQAISHKSYLLVYSIHPLIEHSKPPKLNILNH